MIVDKLQEDSRGGEGLLECAAGEGGLMTSPLNLAYFYGGSPPSAALGASDASFLSSGHSTPGSPGSDSSDFSSSSVSSASSCSAPGESRARGGPRADRVPGSPRPLAHDLGLAPPPCGASAGMGGPRAGGGEEGVGGMCLASNFRGQ